MTNIANFIPFTEENVRTNVCEYKKKIVYKTNSNIDRNEKEINTMKYKKAYYGIV